MGWITSTRKTPSQSTSSQTMGGGHTPKLRTIGAMYTVSGQQAGFGKFVLPGTSDMIEIPSH